MSVLRKLLQEAFKEHRDKEHRKENRDTLNLQKNQTTPKPNQNN